MEVESEIDIKYANLVKRILDHIIKCRTKHSDESLVDLISSFCFENEIDVVEAGDAISQDVQFKELISLELQARPKEIHTELEDW